MTPRALLSAREAAIVLLASWGLLVALQVLVSANVGVDVPPGEVLRACLAALGLGETREGYADPAIAFRLWRALTASGVGACLALSGALLQGLFRNPLASPSLIGVTAGASLGATLALVGLGGAGATVAVTGATGATPLIVTGCAFVGSLAVSAFVLVVAASRRGGTSVATILLLGVAINACIAGFLSAIEDLLISTQNFDTLGALRSWSLGTLEDRRPYHAAMVWIGLAVAAMISPFVATELDLFASGEDDARTLGVSTLRTKVLALTAAAFATACAVAAAGQVGFVGLVVPHIVRMLTGASHRTLLGLSILGGAVIVLGTDLAQVLAIGERRLKPGVLMSLVGGPFFLGLLLARARRGVPW